MSDGNTGGGVCRLTDAVVDKIQTYYGYAIRNNKDNTKNIINAIWAIYYHMICGPNSKKNIREKRNSESFVRKDKVQHGTSTMKATQNIFAKSTCQR